MSFVAFAALWVSPAYAQAPDCSPLREFELRAMVRESKDAIFRDDVLSHKRVWDEFIAEVRCLDHQLPKDAWAELLVSEAIVRNATGGDWQRPLSTVMLVLPDIESVPQYLLDQYESRPPPRIGTIGMPREATLFVDGVLWSHPPELRGDHIAQRYKDGRWDSVWLTDGAQVPAEWLVPDAPEVVEVVAERDLGPWDARGRGAVSAFLGGGNLAQLVDEPGSYLGNTQLLGLQLGVSSHGAQPVAYVFGGGWDVTLPLQLPEVRRTEAAGGLFVSATPRFLPELWLGPAVVLRNVSLVIGGGGLQTGVIEGEDTRLVFLPQPHAALGVRTGRTDFALGGGFTPSAHHGLVRLGVLFDEASDALSWRFGVHGSYANAFLEEVPPGTRRGSVVRVRIAGHVGLAWGRRDAPSEPDG